MGAGRLVAGGLMMFDPGLGAGRLLVACGLVLLAPLFGARLLLAGLALVDSSWLGSERSVVVGLVFFDTAADLDLNFFPRFFLAILLPKTLLCQPSSRTGSDFERVELPGQLLGVELRTARRKWRLKTKRRAVSTSPESNKRIFNICLQE
jgi:hypothetical protein